MDIKVETFEQTIIHNLETIKLFPKVFAYRIVTTTPNGTETSEGITNDVGLRSLKNGVVPKNYYQRVTDKLLDDIRKVGITAMLDHRYKANKETSNRLFDYIAKGGCLDNIVRTASNWTFFRADGTIMPTPIYFDYLNAKTHNGRYDLAKLSELLVARNDITFVDGDEYRSATKMFSDKPIIANVPYCNYRSNCSRHIAFYWTPTQEQADALEAAYKSTPDRFKTIFEADMLGFRAAGAAKYQNYWDEDAPEDEDED